MKISLYFILPAVLAFNIPNINALEIDEKLTLRFLKVSTTQKTVLINRGGEDGLVVGDHAKFFITAGVVARGIAEKVSPSRSVWSLYRIVDPSEIVQDKVLNLKIASPVKITEDPSKSLKEEAIPGGSDTIDVSTNATAPITDEDKDELKDLGFDSDSEVTSTKSNGATKTSSKKTAKQTSAVNEDLSSYTSFSAKTWEFWGTMYFNSLSGTSKSSEENVDATSVSASSIDFSGGVEKYFSNYNNFLKQFSVSLFLHKKSIENGGEIKAKTDYLEYGVGTNYHFYNSAASVNRLIGYGTVTGGIGSANLEANNSEENISVQGTNTFYSLGVGAKYFLNNGFGVRGIIDYYSSNEKFLFDEESESRVLSGPRIQFGLSYRF